MQFGVSTFITDEGIQPGPLASAIEERSLDSLLIAEHTHIPAERRSPYPGGGDLPRKYYRTLDPFLALSAAAQATDRLLLGTGIALIPERDPLITAKEVATLDLVSDGRAVFGVGVGWNREEMANHGADPATRGRLVDERLAAMRKLWTEEQAEYHGEFVDFDPVYSWPKPVQKPHPPIYVGGGEGAFRRVANLGDAWLANGVPPDQLGPQIQRMREVAGRDVPVAVYAADHAPETIAGYAHHDVERVLLYLPTQPYSQSLRQLDTFAEVASRFA